MIATTGTKRNKKYVYYTCLNKNKGIPCRGLNINIDAELVQRLVATEIRKIMKDPAQLGGIWAKLTEDSSPEEAFQKLQNIDQAWNFLAPEQKNKIIQDFVKTV
jgi:hypothetical protein